MRVGRRISMVALNANIDEDLIFESAGFNTIRLDAAGTLQLIGGTADTLAGSVDLNVNGVALFAIDGANRTLVLQAVSGTPCFMNANSLRLTSLGQATTDMDAAPMTKVWGAWTPTLTWTTGTPSGITTIARYCQIGRVVFYSFQTTGTDSNACTNLTVSIPVTSASTQVFFGAAAERYGVAGATYAPIAAYVDPSDDLIHILDFKAATDAQAVSVWVTGFYEV